MPNPSAVRLLPPPKPSHLVAELSNAQLPPGIRCQALGLEREAKAAHRNHIESFISPIF